MKDDLISRQAVIDILEKEQLRAGKDLLKLYLFAVVKEQVGKMENNYDVEKVIEQLEECRDDVIAGLESNYCLSQCKNDDCVVCIFNNVFEIVRKGGID